MGNNKGETSVAREGGWLKETPWVWADGMEAMKGLTWNNRGEGAVCGHIGAGAREPLFLAASVFSIRGCKMAYEGGRDSKGPGNVTGKAGNIKAPLEEQPGGRQQPSPQSRSAGTGGDGQEGGQPPPTTVLVWPSKRKEQGPLCLEAGARGSGKGRAVVRNAGSGCRATRRGAPPSVLPDTDLSLPLQLGGSRSPSRRPPSSQSHL